MADYDTIVIGLGAAGVTAASTLAKAGKQVLALEAESRIGGRVKTVPFADGVVEEGAEWIHGAHGSRTYSIAIQNNIPLVEQNLDSEVFRSDGTMGDSALVEELITFCTEVIEDPPEYPEPVGKFITRRLMAYISDKHPHVLKDQEFLNEFIELMNLFTSSNEATSDWNEVTTKSDYKELDGYQYISWHRLGYKTYFDILLNTYNNGPGFSNLDIKLNKEVTLIKWPKNSTGVVEVTCKDGDRYTANNVIVTVSLGVLKERNHLFHPPLPHEKKLIIDKMSIGVIGKIILEFEKPWWPDSSGSFLMLWKREDRLGVCVEDYWTTQIYACSVPLGCNNALVLWTSGDTSKMVETLPEDVVRRKSMELLRRFMSKKFIIPEPKGMIRSMWYSNPFTRGAYTYDNLQTPQYPNARNTLAEPLLDRSGTPKVLFAGEATHAFHFSTVHGASDSGYREAMRLLPSSKV